MVIIFLFFGYSKCLSYEAQGLILLSAMDHLFFWLYPVFGIRAPVVSGTSEWLFCVLYFGFGTNNWASLEPSGLFCVHLDISIIPFSARRLGKSAGGFPQ